MSTAKFEKLIDLIINENQEQAEQLFHEIVVEKSREIYESLMQEEDLVDDLMSEVESDEVDSMDVSEAEDEDMGDMGDEDMEDMEDMGDEDMGDEDMGDEDMGDMEDMCDEDMGDEDMEDMGDEDMGDMEDTEPATKDDLLDLEDKIDELMAKFEAMMSDDESEESEEGSEEEETEVMEAVEMKKVPQPKGEDHKAVSPVAKKGAMGMAGQPVNFTGSSEAVPTSPKAPSSYVTKGETQVKGAGTFKNSPGAKVSEKGESAPKPKSEMVKAKSPVAESKKTVKKIVK